MDPKTTRDGSIKAATLLGVHVPPTLPLLESGLEMRNRDEVASRILAMHVAAAVAYGFDRRRAISWLDRESASDSLSGPERNFLFNAAADPNRFRLQIEGMWALAWAMSIVNELDFGKDCDSNFVLLLPNLKDGESGAAFRNRMKSRPVDDVISACDLAYCLHWAIRESELTGRQLAGNLKGYVIIERRRALEWLLHKGAWEGVSLDT
jgi:hypothetical protein